MQLTRSSEKGRGNGGRRRNFYGIKGPTAASPAAQLTSALKSISQLPGLKQKQVVATYLSSITGSHHSHITYTFNPRPPTSHHGCSLPAKLECSRRLHLWHANHLQCSPGRCQVKNRSLLPVRRTRHLSRKFAARYQLDQGLRRCHQPSPDCRPQLHDGCRRRHPDGHHQLDLHHHRAVSWREHYQHRWFVLHVWLL